MTGVEIADTPPITPPSAAPDRPGLLSGDMRALTIGLVLVVTLSAFEALAVATAMPVVERDLGGLRIYGLVFSGYVVGSLLATAYAGEQADRGSPVAAFAAGMALFGAGLIIGGAAPAMEVVVLARCIQGLGSGAIATIAYVGIARGYDEYLRPRMFAVLSSAYVIPGLLGPALAGVVAEHISWRLVFLGVLPLLLVAGALSIPALSRLPRPQPGDSNESGRLMPSLQLTVGAALALGGSTLDNPLIVAPMLVAGAVIGIPALRRLLPPGTFTAQPGWSAAVAVMAFATLSFFGAEAFLPFALNEIRDQSPTMGGLALTSATLTWTAASWVQAHRSGEWSRRTMVICGFLLVSVGVAIAGSTVSDGVPVVAAALGWGVAGFGMGLAYSNISLTILSEAPPEQAGQGAASLNIASMVGIAAGTGLGGGLISLGDSGAWDTRTSVALIFGSMATFGVVSAAVALRLPRGVPNPV